MEISKNCTVYYTDEGIIEAVTGGWYDEDLATRYNTLEASFASSSVHYVNNGELLNKDDWEPVAVGNTISGIPSSSRVYINGQELIVTDGIFEIDKPSSVKVKVFIHPITHTSKEVVL